MLVSEAMKVSALGYIVGIGVALLPFVATDQLFYGSVNAKFFYGILCVNLLALYEALRLWREHQELSFRGWIIPSLLLIASVGVVSAVVGVYPEHSWWSESLRSTGLLFLFHVGALAVLTGTLLKEQDWSFVRKSIALSGGLFGLLTLLGKEGFGLSGEFLSVNLDLIGLTFGNSTFAGAYLLLAFVVGCIEWFRLKGERRWRGVLLTSLVLMAVSPVLLNTGILFGKTPLTDLFGNPTLLLGSARASGAALLVFLGFLALVFVGKRFVPARHAGVSLAGLSAIFLFSMSLVLVLLFTPGSAVQEAYIKTSTAARIIAWEATGNAIAERPLFGWGPENFSFGFEKHFDNRLYLEENIAEIWFDRAHNVFLDTLMGWGIVGVLAFLFLCVTLWRAVWSAYKKKRIAWIEAVVLGAFPILHLLQTQTGFDTTGSYLLLGLITGYYIFLERDAEVRPSISLPGGVGAARAYATLVGLIALSSIIFILVPEWSRQNALFQSFQPHTSEERLALIQESVSRPSDYEALRLSSGSYLQTLLIDLEKIPNPEQARPIAEPFLLAYKGAFKRHLEEAPLHYRARMNYAYFLLTETVFGTDKREEARAIIRDSYELSPGNPITYVLDGLASLYDGDAKTAREKFEEALALNPDIEFSQAMIAYLERQEKKIPNITILNLKNL